MEERDTGGLSGGELQRLAVAAALARQPAMLIADEVTSMVDQPGREALLRVLSGLTDRHHMSLVHITHYNNEVEFADRTINLSESEDNTETVESTAAPAPTADAPARTGAPLLTLDRVGYVYASGTPWAKTALRDISFGVHQGDGLLIHGGNGSASPHWLGSWRAWRPRPPAPAWCVTGPPTNASARWRSRSRPPAYS